MATNRNNGVASMYYYSNNRSQTTDDDPDKKTAAIVFAVAVVGLLLVRLLCFCIKKDREEQEQRYRSEDGGLVDRAPSMVVDAGAALEVASPVRAAEPPLVCTYRKADGWKVDSCGVCLAELADGEVLRVLPVCLHYFHDACVGEWLRGHDTCPLCRAPLVGPAAAA